MNIKYDQVKEMYREAFDRGERDYERGLKRCESPFKTDNATYQNERWLAGYDNAAEYDKAR